MTTIVKSEADNKKIIELIENAETFSDPLSPEVKKYMQKTYDVYEKESVFKDVPDFLLWDIVVFIEYPDVWNAYSRHMARETAEEGVPHFIRRPHLAYLKSNMMIEARWRQYLSDNNMSEVDYWTELFKRANDAYQAYFIDFCRNNPYQWGPWLDNSRETSEAKAIKDIAYKTPF